MRAIFDHEKLDVYKDAIEFVSWAESALSESKIKAAAREQLEGTKF